MLQRLGAQALRAAAKPSGRRKWSHDKGKINPPAISRFEDLSQSLILLGCGVFSVSFLKLNLSNAIHLILYVVFLLGYYHVKYIIIIRLLRGLKLRKIEQLPSLIDLWRGSMA